MTIKAKLLCAVAMTAFAVVAVTSSARALSQQECGAKYQTAKAAGTLNGQNYNQFRKAECGADAAAAPAAAPAPSAASPAPAPKAVEAKPKKPEAAPAAAPVAVGNAVFPTAVDPKYAKEKEGLAREHTCADQWKANKAANTTGGMKWNQKGGGYYSECNRRLKA